MRVEGNCRCIMSVSKIVFTLHWYQILQNCYVHICEHNNLILKIKKYTIVFFNLKDNMWDITDIYCQVNHLYYY